MEESAIRETFEEAGVLGILGPRLTEIEYETRKAKKRRLEFEEVQRKAKQMRDAPSPSPKSPEAAIRNCEDRTPQSSAAKISSDSVHSATIAPSSPPSASALEQHVPDKVLHRIRGHASKSHHSSDAETASVASESSTNTYTHVRMTLMPLYVTEVRGEWPERGRFRKAVDIDEAIRITESRPEFQAALIEVKEKNLHLPHLNKPSSTANVVTPSAPMAPSSNGSTGTATLLWNAKER
jgi:diphosphoinositol-polyphosphate diphosphatase